MMEQRIKVEGMTCNHCKSSVEGALNQLDGVNNAAVNLEENNVQVAYEEGKVNFDQMKEAIEDQGYDVEA
ncbi:copper chaperone CopZ [Mammaliicoccus lentus]|nr:copper chaperone CopZ [Mammaliicoccus lentus]WHI56034.1 copper chaperone CopZ [Mammaliicoccus lentus]WHI58533.1 copper chaperone CopZ [Mammaliicoccus lentus]WHI66382.1 copper chaperone CopZ [Mammaliicoccus lentus]WHI87277.1 copper chaperone CopZ [Mammaliicoccus lentus]WHI91783.1 copper chaperone CopZ [Mammaliicoccus lentus]